jgi:hypothetical protein
MDIAAIPLAVFAKDDLPIAAINSEDRISPLPDDADAAERCILVEATWLRK